MKAAISAVIQPLSRVLNQGHQRSVKAKKNIFASFFIKGLSIGVSLLLVPLTINYVNPSQYGIWLTLSSIIGWFSFFDIGLTQGLRNKFAEAKARGDHRLAKIYVSTTYAILGIIFTVVWILFLVSNQFLNWSQILNVTDDLGPEISILALIVMTYFCLQFIFRVITTLLKANQEPAKSSLIDVLGQVTSLLIIFILVYTTQGSLVYLGLALCVSPLLILIGANVFFFRKQFRPYKPSVKSVRFSYAKDLFNLGVIFFVIQIAAIIQYQSANIIIARSFGTNEVTAYNIVYKYFNIITMVNAIFVTPLWSAATEAYLKRDFSWIKRSMRMYNLLNLALLLISVVMLLFSETIYDLWLGDGVVEIDFKLSLWGFFFMNVGLFASKYVQFLNGISALRLQFWSSVITPFLYIGVALLLIKYFELGVYSLFIAAIISNINGFLIAPIQYFQIIFKNKKGIWVK